MARPANESTLPFPPYGSFVNFLNDLGAMEVLPNQLNQQVFASSYSGSARAQILKAFSFFGLMNADNKPVEEKLGALLKAETRKKAMEALLREHYKALIDLPLETAGPAEVNQWFLSLGMDASTARKAKSFFLTAAKENDIKMHSLVMDRTVRRAPGSRGRRRRKRDEGAGTDQQPPANNNQGQNNSGSGDGILFHPSVDAFLREARKLTEGERWTADARQNVISGFTTQLDLFLPVKSKAQSRAPRASESGAAES